MLAVRKKCLPLQPQNFSQRWQRSSLPIVRAVKVSARHDMGKSCTASSLRILQDGNVAKVVGCSGAM